MLETDIMVAGIHKFMVYHYFCNCPSIFKLCAGHFPS